MAYSYQSEVSDGTLQRVILSISFYNKEDVHVSVDGRELSEADGEYSWEGDVAVHLRDVVPAGQTCILRRSTDMSKLRLKFSEGVAFTRSNLDDQNNQFLHMGQEAKESAISDVYNDIDMHYFRIRNAGDPVKDLDYTTKRWVVNTYAEAVNTCAASALSASNSAATAGKSAASAISSADDALASAIRAEAAAGVVGPQVKEALRRSYAEVGFNLVSGSFEDGAIITDHQEVLLQCSTGKCFNWQGVIPVGGKVIPADSTPESTGGIGAGKWQDVTNTTRQSQAQYSDGVYYQTYYAWQGDVILQYRDEAVQFKQGGLFYRWDGEYPQGGLVIPQNTPEPSPAQTGVDKYVAVLDLELRSLLKNQTREALRRTYADAGYALVAGSFEAGGTITAKSDCMLQEFSGVVYAWRGDIPSDGKVVPAGSTPETSGGIGNDKWKDVTLALLQYDTVADMIANCSNAVGTTVRTRGLRIVGDGGGSTYEIVAPSSNIPLTSYPNEFGSVMLDNGSVAAKDITSIPQKPRWWAHRGGQRWVAENTILSVSQAIKNGAYGIEVDACMSSDGIWYVFHDDELSVQTTGTGKFYNRDSAYIQSLEFKKLAGTRYATTAKIPRLQYLIEYASRNGVPVTIEFKYPRPATRLPDIEAGIRMIVDSGIPANWHVQSTLDDVSETLRKVSSEIKLSMSLASLANADVELPDLGSRFGNVIIQIASTTSATPEFKHGVALARALGMDVIGYTANNTATDANELMRSGVFNIISDRGWE